MISKIRATVKSRTIESLLVCLTIFAVSGCSQKSGSISAGTELKEGQRIAEIQLISIVGNEITYVETAAEKEGENEVLAEADMGTESGEADDVSETGQSSDMTEVSQAREQEDGMPGMDQMKEQEDGMSEMGQVNNQGGMNIVTTYLPVGVIVYTDTNKETGFSILEDGDSLEVMFEEDEDGGEVITRIWMLSE